MTTKPPLQKILQEILHTEDESKLNQRGWEILNHRRRKDRKSESNIDSAAHKHLNNENN
jgi:hypothetical protein